MVGAQSVPHYSEDSHIGVASCSGSACHGAAEAWKKSNVQQNEYAIWSRDDPHSGAYTDLKNDQSRRIAANLGLENAHEAKLCLDCHTDNVAESKQGYSFQLSDGVGCEACHGGASGWLGTHISADASHEKNLAAGMYPTDEPEARADLCLSCHFGDSRKFVTHRIMGAGHPRMPFELDTFTATQPAHYTIDADYHRRKQVYSGVQIWAIGQAKAMIQILDGLLDPQRRRDGMFPELVFYDCHACHESMARKDWRRTNLVGLDPGTPRLNDANAVMLVILAEAIEAETGSALRAQVRGLHAASAQGVDKLVAASEQLKQTLTKVVKRFAEHRFGEDDLRSIVLGLTDFSARDGGYLDYADAEQATMALSAILATISQSGLYDAQQIERLNAGLNSCYSVVEDDDAYSREAFRKAAAQVREALPGS